MQAIRAPAFLCSFCVRTLSRKIRALFMPPAIRAHTSSFISIHRSILVSERMTLSPFLSRWPAIRFDRNVLRD